MRDVEAGFVVAHQFAPARHPAERALHHPAPGQHLEARLSIAPAHDLKDEIPEHGLVEQLGAGVRPIGKQVLQPWPLLAYAVQNELRARAVRHVGWGEVQHQQASIRVDDNVPLASDRLPGGIVAPGRAVRRLDGLAVQHACGRARLSPSPLAVEHERHVVDRLEQQAADEPAEPPVDRLPRTKIRRQHPPAAAAAGHVADRVQHFPQVHADLSAAFWRLGHERLDPDPLFVGQVSRIPLGLARNVGHPATALSGPHPKLESQPPKPPQPFSNEL